MTESISSAAPRVPTIAWNGSSAALTVDDVSLPSSLAASVEGSRTPSVDEDVAGPDLESSPGVSGGSISSKFYLSDVLRSDSDDDAVAKTNLNSEERWAVASGVAVDGLHPGASDSILSVEEVDEP